jgi:hypothetical protein
VREAAEHEAKLIKNKKSRGAVVSSGSLFSALMITNMFSAGRAQHHDGAGT